MRNIYLIFLLARTTLSCKSATPKEPLTQDVDDLHTATGPEDTSSFGEAVKVSINSQCQIIKNGRNEKRENTQMLSRRKRVVGGQEVEDSEHPWAVKIEYILGATRQHCGGILINMLWVLTAAHCFQGINKQWNLNNINVSVYNPVTRKRDLYTVSKINIHPSYEVSKTAFNYDAALIKLDIPKSVQEELTPACVSPTLDIDNIEAKAFGWGYVDEKSKLFSKNLKEIDLYIYPNGECYYRDAHFMQFSEEQMVCAGPEDKTVDDESTCNGDSGGGLMVTTDDSNRTASVVGIVSWSFHCAGPTVFQRVAPIHSWILVTIARDFLKYLNV